MSRKSRTSRRPTSPVGRRLGSQAEVRAARRRGSVDAPAIRVRQAVVVAGIALAWAALVLRAGQLQLIEADQYADAATRQASTSVEVEGRRGSILDRHGAELAMSVDVDSVFAEPRRVSDPARAARALAPILERPARELAERLGRDAAFVYLARRVERSVGARVRALGLPGIGTHTESKRFYGGGRLGSHVLGFVNIDEQGRAGIERRLDAHLQGERASIAALRDALGNKVLVDGVIAPKSLDGRSVRLTLDRAIQHAAEVELEAAIQQQRASAGVALVMDIRTGDLLAMASYPDFNPNRLTSASGAAHLNRAIASVYEPGSTMKIATIAAALEERVIERDGHLDCEGGRWRVGGRTIGDADHAFDRLSLTEVMVVSSNICSAKLGMELGARKLHDWLVRFGFGSRLGLDLPGEVNGILRTPEQWRPIDLANVAFGQGVGATPLQVIVMAAAVANDGVRVQPRVVDALQQPDGTWEGMPREPPVRVLSSQTARALREMLVAVVEEGTGRKAAIPGLSVAGKTGTSQKFDRDRGTYSDEDYVASFVGFAPSDAPQLAALVVVDEPRGSIFGTTAAAPAFRRIMTEALRARGWVLPEVVVEADAQLAEVDEDVAALTAPLELDLSSEARALLALGAPSPEPPSAMPRLMGQGAREVLKRCAEAGCVPVLVGTGRVVEQDPSPGAAVDPGSTWKVRLQPSSGKPR